MLRKSAIPRITQKACFKITGTITTVTSFYHIEMQQTNKAPSLNVLLSGVFLCASTTLSITPIPRTIVAHWAASAIVPVCWPLCARINCTAFVRCDGGSGPHAYRTGFWQINCISFPIHNYMIEQICICMLAVTAIRARALKWNQIKLFSHLANMLRVAFSREGSLELGM